MTAPGSLQHRQCTACTGILGPWLLPFSATQVLVWMACSVAARAVASLLSAGDIQELVSVNDRAFWAVHVIVAGYGHTALRRHVSSKFQVM